MELIEFSKLDSKAQAQIVRRGDDNWLIHRAVRWATSTLLVLTVAVMGGCPQYNVWRQGLVGEAELARAEQNRQIAVNEAMALKEAAAFKADAEIERARGIDEANKVIAQSLGGPEGYLRYLYIDALSSTNCETIYIPTEANLPILEASRKKPL